MNICVDFDGTVVTHEYPEIGKPVPKALEVLKELIAEGHTITLFTMRSGEPLDQAANYLRENGVPLYGINENPTQKKWTQSPKAYGHLYIDDAAVGCPLILKFHRKPVVDWDSIRMRRVERGALSNGKT